jgi:nucleoside-diphosphate-sugar epimerase
MGSEKICVVGCSGFVGSHVAAELLARGYDVQGTLRDATGEKARWLMSGVAAAASGANKLTLFSSPVIAPETIDLMLAVAENVSDAAIEAGIGRAVFTSSTGSTNPPEGEPDLKNEELHWSDPDVQLAAKKFAAVGKTRLDQIVLGKMAASDGAFRVCTINPSMIVGPAFQDEPVTSLIRFAAIVNGERFADKVPNSSMSMIDVRDLAALHVNAMERESARGRYFGVKQSWLWRDILQALERAYPAYKMPAADPDEVPVRATQFDLTRQNTLGVNLRGLDALDAMLAGVIEELQRREMI